MKNALDRKVHVDNLWQSQLHQGQENALDSFTHPAILHRGLAYDRSGVDRILAVRDAGDVKDGVVILQGVEAGMVSKRTFRTKLIELYVAFKNNLSVGRNFEIHGFALH